MTTPSPAESIQRGPGEATPADEAWGKASSWSRIAMAALCWLAASLLPFNDLLRGAIIGVICLAASAVARPLTARLWRPLARATSVFVLAAAATAIVRFVVPELHSDSPLVRVGAYLLFLGIFIGSFFLQYRMKGFGKRAEEQIQYAFWRDLCLSLVYTGVILAALYLLARFFSVTVTLIVFAVDVAVALMVLAARKAFRAEASADRQSSWIVAELLARHPVFPTLSLMLLAVGLIAYPIAAGVIYFAGDVPSDEVTTWVFRLTLTAFIFMGLPLVVFVAVATLASPNVGEKVRVRQLVTMSAGLLNVGLYLSLFLWSSQPSGTESEVEASSAVVSFSPVVVGVLLGYFFLVVLIPYAIGTTRSLRQERRFLNAQHRILGELIVSLERPHQARLGAALRRSRRELDEMERTSMCENAVLSLAERGRRLDPQVRARIPKMTSTSRASLKSTYQRTRADQRRGLVPEDPRIRFWEQLNAMRRTIDEIGFSLAKLSASGQRDIVLAWADFLRRRREDIDRYVSSRPRTRIPAWLTLGGIVAPVVSVVLDQFGNWIWTQIADSFPS